MNKSKKKFAIGFTYDLEEEYRFQKDDPKDANAEFDLRDTIRYLGGYLETLGHKVMFIGNFYNLLRHYQEIKKKVDIVFNLAEGLTGRNREAQVPILLESLNIPFVGSDSLTLSLALDKVATKKILIYEGIRTPKFINIEKRVDGQLIHDLHFPLFVKPRWEGSSKGINEKSKVKNKEELKTQVNYIIKTYKQPALVEEFIIGREYTVPLIGNEKVEILPIVQYQNQGKDMMDEFYTNRHVYDEELQYILAKDLDKQLEKEIKDLALRTYEALECKDFGRVDFRVDEEGRPYVLEINPIPALALSDVFGVISKHLCMDYSAMLGRILDAALKRYGMI